MIVDRREMTIAVEECSRVADKKSSMPILACLLLVSKDGQCRVTGTNLHTTLIATLPCEGQDIEVCIPAAELLRLIGGKSRRWAEVVAIGPGPLGENVAQVTVTGMTSMVATMPVSDFPLTPDEDRSWGTIGRWDQEALRALSWVVLASSTDGTRPHMNGVLFDRERAIASDGHRLHYGPFKSEHEALVPRDVVATMLRLARDGAVMERDGGHSRIRTGNFTLYFFEVAAKFPPYEKVIPSGQTGPVLSMNGATLANGLRRIARGKNEPVLGSINGTFKLISEAVDVGRSELEVFADISGKEPGGDDFVFAVNPRYWMEAVELFETVRVCFQGPTDGIVIKGDPGHLAVVMPTRL